MCRVDVEVDDWSDFKLVMCFFPAEQRAKRGRARKKSKRRRAASCQRVTMVTASEADPGLAEDPEDNTSLDRRETRKRTFGICPFFSPKENQKCFP